MNEKEYIKQFMDSEGMIHADESVMQKKENAPEKITEKDLLAAYSRWWWANEVPHTYDRMLAPSFLFGMIPILKKLYKDPAMKAESYQRHLLFFNTQCNWGGGTLTGITASLEEERAIALAHPEGKEPIDVKMINNTKVGLMGPLAGIGDAIDSGTVQYIIIAILLPLSQEGNPLGAILTFLIFVSLTFAYGFAFTRLGYKLGRNAAKEIMTGTKMKQIMDSLGVLGLFMMGVLSSQYVKVSSSLKFSVQGKEFVIQQILDKILPGILPLATVMALYLFFEKKGLKITKGMLLLTTVLIILALVRIL